MEQNTFAAQEENAQSKNKPRQQFTHNGSAKVNRMSCQVYHSNRGSVYILGVFFFPSFSL